MRRDLRVLAAAGSLSLAFLAANGAFAQKTGGILHLGHFKEPALPSSGPRLPGPAMASASEATVRDGTQRRGAWCAP